MTTPIPFGDTQGRGTSVFSRSPRRPVLTLFYQFNPWRTSIGGIQTIVKSFVKYAPADFEIRLVGIEDEPDRPTGFWQARELFGQPVQFLPLFTVPDDNVRQPIPTTLRYTAALLKRRIDSDFMHFHRLEPAIAARAWAGDKTLFIHNDIQQQMQGTGGNQQILWRYFPSLYFALEGWLVRQFDQIYSCNSNSLALYQYRYPDIADRLAFFCNTVDTEIFYPFSPAERLMQSRRLAEHWGFPPDRKYLLFAGRLHPQKDPLLLVRSLAALNDPSVHLLIAGAGELLGEVQQEVDSLGLSGQVTFLGSVPQADLADFHRISSLYVLTSVYEGLPLGVLEALACGTPVVSTHCGETPKLLPTNCGVICGDRTPQSVAAAFRRVLDHPEAFPPKACVRASQPYSAQAVIGQVYNDMRDRWENRRIPVPFIHPVMEV